MPERLEAEQIADKLSPEQRKPLLRTKLFAPPIRLKRVARPFLLEQLNSSLDKALMLVSAPAGFGKSTLLAEWAAQASIPVGWLSLDSGDNDPIRFLKYWIAALRSALPVRDTDREAPVCGTAQAMLQSIQPLPIQSILVSLINDLTEITEPFALVLDDYQFISSPAVHEALTFILEHLSPNAHLVIASRVDPAIPLHRLRAAQRLLEIRMDDLRFSGDESAAFMNTVMALNLSREDVSTLTARTEGWIVGLQMAALSMQGIADRPAFVQAFSGSHRFILEYLIEEVLNRQPEDIQAFLLRTSVLDRLCGPLCDAVLENQDSQAIIERLERSNLFLSPLDQVGCWYRYHHLFADLLQARLKQSQPEMLPVLHLRTSHWYEEEGLPEEAIQHALAAQETERAARLVERYAIEILSRGEMTTLLRMYEALPEELVRSRPKLGVLLAFALTFSGHFDHAEARLEEVEEQIKTGGASEEAREIRGSIAIIRGLIADMRGEMVAAIGLARQADELLPKNNLAERSIIPFVLGDGYSATGDLDEAELAFEKIHQIGRASGNLWTLTVALHKQALVKKMQGRLHAAADLYQEAIQLASERGAQRYGTMGGIYVGMSELLHEWNELDAAREMVTSAIQNMERWQSPTNLVNGYVTLARIALSQREIETAEDELEKAKHTSRQGKIFSITLKHLESFQVRLWLTRGDLARARQWVSENGLEDRSCTPGVNVDYLSELDWIAAARVLIASNELVHALDLLTTLQESAKIAGRNGRLIEILILTALALHRSGKKERAFSILADSLALAEPEGYLRVYLDEGRQLEELLKACAGRLEGSQKAYAGRLLHAFTAPGEERGDTPAAPKRSDSMVESLTVREAEVLRLLAAGLSNQEIAERLVISQGTVKTHTHNLYGKLGVQTRTQAIARAKELNLI